MGEFREHTPLNFRKVWKSFSLGYPDSVTMAGTLGGINYAASSAMTLYSVYRFWKYLNNRKVISQFCTRLPFDYITGTDIKIQLIWTTSVTTGNVRWLIGVTKEDSNMLFNGDSNMQSIEVIDTTISNGSYYAQKTPPATFTGTNFVPGMNLGIPIMRDATHTSDTLAGTCYIHKVIIYYQAQTLDGYANREIYTALDPLVDGGFENETSTFAANGWTQVGPSSGSTWYVGTAGGSQSGTKSAWIGTNPSNYGGILTAGIKHFYRDIAIPAKASKVRMNWYLKYPITNPTRDYIYVFATTTSNTPVDGILPTTGYKKLFMNTATQYLNFTAMPEINLDDFVGKTVRIVFTNVNNDIAPYSNPAVDNISITYNYEDNRVFVDMTPILLENVTQIISIPAEDFYRAASTFNGINCSAATKVVLKGRFIGLSMRNKRSYAGTISLTLPYRFKPGAPLTFEFDTYTSTATSGNVKLYCGIANVTPESIYKNDASFTYSSVIIPFTTPFVRTRGTITFPESITSGWNSGDIIGIVIYRNSADIEDTLNGNFHVVNMTIKFPIDRYGIETPL